MCRKLFKYYRNKDSKIIFCLVRLESTTQKNEGGFNVKKIFSLNKTMICKWICNLDKNQEHNREKWAVTWNIRSTDFWSIGHRFVDS